MFNSKGRRGRSGDQIHASSKTEDQRTPAPISGAFVWMQGSIGAAGTTSPASDANSLSVTSTGCGPEKEFSLPSWASETGDHVGVVREVGLREFMRLQAAGW